jgi:hypothetical protein
MTPDSDTINSIIDSRSFKLTITGCHGGIVGKNHCNDEIMVFDSLSVKYYSGDDIYIRYLDEIRWDSLYKYFNYLITIHQPDKNLKKDGFGCTYHDYNYTFENDSIRTTIKPREGNGIYYRIEDLMNIKYYWGVFGGSEYMKKLDSSDLIGLKGHKITEIKKLTADDEYFKGLMGINIFTTYSDTSISILPTPNPGLSIKEYAPYIFYQPFNDFKEFEILPERKIQSISTNDELLNKIIDLKIEDIYLQPILGDKYVDSNNLFGYKINNKDRFKLVLQFENDLIMTIDNHGEELIIQ